MIISYNLENSLYLNLTNRCSNSCDFCLRTAKDSKDIIDSERWITSNDLSGTNELWLDHEPTFEEVICDLEKRDLTQYKEVVFCGFGEPFERFSDCKKIAKWLKEKNVTTRVNTNGQVNLIEGRDVTPELKGLFDTVSISLNNKNAKEYQDTCHSVFGEEAFSELLSFGEKCASLGINTIFSVVDILPKEDIEICRVLAESRGCKLRVREYIS